MDYLSNEVLNKLVAERFEKENDADSSAFSDFLNRISATHFHNDGTLDVGEVDGVFRDGIYAGMTHSSLVDITINWQGFTFCWYVPGSIESVTATIKDWLDKNELSEEVP
jgi:hypothetical protein